MSEGMLVPNEIGCWPCRTTFGALLACQESFRFGGPLRSPPPPQCAAIRRVSKLHYHRRHSISFHGFVVLVLWLKNSLPNRPFYVYSPWTHFIGPSRVLEHVWRATVVTGGDKNFDDSNRGFMRL